MAYLDELRKHLQAHLLAAPGSLAEKIDYEIWGKGAVERLNAFLKESKDASTVEVKNWIKEIEESISNEADNSWLSWGALVLPTLAARSRKTRHAKELAAEPPKGPHSSEDQDRISSDEFAAAKAARDRGYYNSWFNGEITKEACIALCMEPLIIQREPAEAGEDGKRVGSPGREGDGNVSGHPGGLEMEEVTQGTVASGEERERGKSAASLSREDLAEVSNPAEVQPKGHSRRDRTAVRVPSKLVHKVGGRMTVGPHRSAKASPVPSPSRRTRKPRVRGLGGKNEGGVKVTVAPPVSAERSDLAMGAGPSKRKREEVVVEGTREHKRSKDDGHREGGEVEAGPSGAAADVRKGADLGDQALGGAPLRDVPGTPPRPRSRTRRTDAGNVNKDVKDLIEEVAEVVKRSKEPRTVSDLRRQQKVLTEMLSSNAEEMRALMVAREGLEGLLVKGRREIEELLSGEEVAIELSDD